MLVCPLAYTESIFDLYDAVSHALEPFLAARGRGWHRGRTLNVAFAFPSLIQIYSCLCGKNGCGGLEAIYCQHFMGFLQPT